MKKIFTFIFLSIISIFGYCDDFKVLASSDLSEQSNIPKITKGENDRKTYQLIQLQNGLRALLISDPNSDKAAASMRIFSGSFDDPDEMPGVAHFTEHMLYFSGKPENYGQYENYIKEHSGTENASTSSDSTLHYFEIGKNNFIEALNQFSKLFRNKPADKFVEKIDEEENIVDSEHKNNLSSDFYKNSYIDRTTANPNHPYSKFSTGNLETLNAYGKEQLVNAVKAFMKKHYVANNMLLTLYSPKSIKEMQSLVTENFAHLESGCANDQNISAPVYRKEDLAQIVSIQPHRDKDEMSLSFPIEEHISQYQTKPEEYVLSMLRRQDLGSLYEYLIRQNWIETGSGIGTNIDSVDKNTSICSMHFTLTSEGLKNYTTIIEATFAWLQLIAEKGMEKWRFDEMQLINQTIFDEQSKSSNALQQAKYTGQHIKSVKIQDLLTSQNLLFDFNSDNIKRFIAKITPSNMRIRLITKTAQTNQTEKYYGGYYQVEPIDSMLLQNWKTPETGKFNFQLRGPNNHVNQLKETITAPARQPKAVEDQQKKPTEFTQEEVKIWMMPDDIFGDKRIALTNILSVTKFNNTLEHFLLGTIYVEMLNEHLRMKYASAIDVGYAVGVNLENRSFKITVTGYLLEKLAQMIENVNDEMMHFSTDQSRFEVFKAQLIKAYNNDLYTDPDYRIIYESQRDLLNGWTFTERARVIQGITWEKFQDFIENRALFGEIGMEAFIYGNIDQHKFETTNAQETIIASLRKNLRANFVRRSTKMDQKTSDAAAKSTHPAKKITTKHNDHALLEIYPTVIEKDDYTAMAEMLLLGRIIQPVFYNKIRTEKGLSYSPFSGFYADGIHHTQWRMNFSAQQTTEETMQREENWLRPHFDDCIGKHMPEALNALIPEKLETIKQSLIALLTQRPRNSAEVYHNILFEIVRQRYDFNHAQNIANAASNVTVEALRDRYHQLIMPENRHIYGANVEHIAMTNWDKPTHTTATSIH